MQINNPPAEPPVQLAADVTLAAPSAKLSSGALGSGWYYLQALVYLPALAMNDSTVQATINALAGNTYSWTRTNLPVGATPPSQTSSALTTSWGLGLQDVGAAFSLTLTLQQLDATSTIIAAWQASQDLNAATNKQAQNGAGTEDAGAAVESIEVFPNLENCPAGSRMIVMGRKG